MTEKDVTRHHVDEEDDSVQIDFDNDLTEINSARLEKAFEKTAQYKPSRTQSHFIEMNNSNNEESLLDAIEAEKSLNEMVFDEQAGTARKNSYEDELLI